jgi:hypothetical protein
MFGTPNSNRNHLCGLVAELSSVRQGTLSMGRNDIFLALFHFDHYDKK